MAARKSRQQTSRKSSRPLKDHGAAPSPVSAPENLQAPASSRLPLRDWAVLFYLCGDHPELEAHIERQLEALGRAGSSEHIHIAVQRDRSRGAERFVIPQGSAAVLPAAEEMLGGLDTGDAARAMEFLRWGLERCPSRHVAVVFGGAGISHGKSVIGSPEEDPSRLFAFCDDATTQNALYASALQDIFRQALEPTGREKVDLILFDMCRMQFLEVAYQLEGVADVMVGAQTMFPDKGWPYQQLLSRWEAKIESVGRAPAENIAKELARIAVEIAGEEYGGPEAEAVTVSALDLTQLDEVTRVFDTLMLAFMQSLGEKLVWRARIKVTEQCRPTSPFDYDLQEFFASIDEQCRVAAENPVEVWYSGFLKKLAPLQRKEIEQLIARDGSAELEQKIEASLERLPDHMRSDFLILQGQRERAKHLARLAVQALSVVKPALPGDRQAEVDAERFIFARAPQNCSRCGVSVYRPTDLDNLRDSNYLSLNFHRRIHWVSLLGAINLIEKHPRALWRLVSSVLATASGGARNDLLRALAGPSSVLGGFRDQFRALAAPPSLTLSLEKTTKPVPPPEPKDYYRLRLESSESGATINEQDSRINPDTIEDALAGLERLLKQPWVEPDELEYLEALGHTLGEDIIENLSDNLAQERQQAELEGRGDDLHLQMQMPQELMRYPWELMSDRRGMLCERYALGRQVFMKTGLARRVAPRRQGSIRVLIVGDPVLKKPRMPRELPGAREEAEQITTLFERLGAVLGDVMDFQRYRDVSIHEIMTKAQFRHKLRRGHYDIIHFAGHALFNPQDPESSAWLLSDGPLWAKEIRNTLAWCDSPPWLVFANACESGMDSDAAPSRYQGDVFGLATAFINQGVAAYIGPLWPIDDGVALQMASDFYSALLLERASLGESLRFAKREAKRLVLGEEGEGRTGGTVPRSPRTGLSWAGLVLYGDPTTRLSESLWSPQRVDAPAATKPLAAISETPLARRRRTFRRSLRPLQAPVEETRKLVKGPGMEEQLAAGVRGVSDVPSDQILLELVEVNGIRYWEIIDGQTGQPIEPAKTSVVKQIAKDEQVRGHLGLQRGWKDYLRVIGSWLVGREKNGLIKGLVHQYDVDTVSEERLLLVQPDCSLERLDGKLTQQVDRRRAGDQERVLLIIHGTFSKTESPVIGLGQKFFEWAYLHYDRVIGYDHWTLSKSPEENAGDLTQLVSKLWKNNLHLDIITHSRGGLEARSLVEIQNDPLIKQAVKQVIFVGTPNCGTDLANPQNWGDAADLLVNLLHLDPPPGIYGRLSGMLARLVASRVTTETLKEIPGLWAQKPIDPEAADVGHLLSRLKKSGELPEGLTYSAVATNYEPGGEMNVLRLLNEAKNIVLDKFYKDYNDLVVNTTHVWTVDGDANTTTASKRLPAERLLIYNPRDQMGVPRFHDVAATSVDLAGVHHTNLFSFDQTRKFLQTQLSKK